MGTRTAGGVETRALSAASAGELERVWRGLEAKSDNSFFLSWHWIGAWARVAAPAGSLIVAKQGDAPIGAAVVVRSPRSLRNPLRMQYRLHETGKPHIDGLFVEYNSFLADRAAGDAVLQAIVAELSKNEQLWHRLARRELIINAASPEFAAAVLKRFPNTSIFRRDQSPFVNLDRLRRSGTDYLSALSSNSRQQLRRARRAFQEFGPLRFERAVTVQQAREFLRDLKLLHVARWQTKGKQSGFDNPAFEPMLNELICDGVPKGVVEVSRVIAGDLLLGYLFNFYYRGAVMNYTSGFQYAVDNRLKPGLVAHLVAIEDADRTGALSYKFLAGNGRYKTSLSTDSEELLGLSIPF